jgi:hypothetical protein
MLALLTLDRWATIVGMNHNTIVLARSPSVGVLLARVSAQR